jgi:hypothetical protein
MDSLRKVESGNVWRFLMSELYYKGIYPVEVVQEVYDDLGKCELKIRAKRRFLDTSNYSNFKRLVKPGEELVVPAKLVWSHRRNVAKGYL